MHPSHLEEQKDLWKKVVLALLPVTSMGETYQTADRVVEAYASRYQQHDPFTLHEEQHPSDTLNS